jgi:hypothetical protein
MTMNATSTAPATIANTIAPTATASATVIRNSSLPTRPPTYTPTANATASHTVNATASPTVNATASPTVNATLSRTTNLRANATATANLTGGQIENTQPFWSIEAITGIAIALAIGVPTVIYAICLTYRPACSPVKMKAPITTPHSVVVEMPRSVYEV